MYITSISNLCRQHETKGRTCRFHLLSTDTLGHCFLVAEEGPHTELTRNSDVAEFRDWDTHFQQIQG